MPTRESLVSAIGFAERDGGQSVDVHRAAGARKSPSGFLMADQPVEPGGDRFLVGSLAAGAFGRRPERAAAPWRWPPSVGLGAAPAPLHGSPLQNCGKAGQAPTAVGILMAGEPVERRRPRPARWPWCRRSRRPSPCGCPCRRERRSRCPLRRCPALAAGARAGQPGPRTSGPGPSALTANWSSPPMPPVAAAAAAAARWPARASRSSTVGVDLRRVDQAQRVGVQLAGVERRLADLEVIERRQRESRCRCGPRTPGHRLPAWEPRPCQPTAPWPTARPRVPRRSWPTTRHW